MIWRDKTLGQIFEKVAKEHGLPAADVRELFEKYFEYGQKCIADDRLPEVNYYGLGTLIPMKSKTERYIEILEEKEDIESIPELRKSLERMEYEKNKRKRKKS